MDNVKDFFLKYRGAIIGALIAIVALLLNIYKFIIGIITIFIGMYIGNYIQHNKEIVKIKIKDFIDRL